MVVTRFWVTPCAMLPASLPFSSVTEMFCGGQVEKKPAEEPEPFTEAVMAVVPGNCAVIWLVSLLMVAIAGVPTVKLNVPIAAVQVGSEVTPLASPPLHA